jgi:SPP1 family predicted phage head-tail adaptor
MNPGSLDRKARLYQLTDTIGEDGSVTPSLVAYTDIWVKRIPLSGSVAAKAARDVASIEVQFSARYSSAIKAMHRILVDGIYYEIQRVDEIGRKAELMIWAKQKDL